MTKDITIVAVDTYAHDLTRIAIERTLGVLPCQEVLVLSDKNIYPAGRWVDINPIGIEEYSKIMLKHLWPFIRTEHILVIQYDGMAIDANNWTDDFLNYDYIGASWPWAHHPPGFKVGNGGFSLRSRRLLNMLKSKEVVEDVKYPHYEDLYIGVHYKQHLTEQGAVIADVAVANKFSTEFPPGKKDTFGFHGCFNIPYYLGETDAVKFMELMPAWTSEGAVMMIPHCFAAGNPLLGQLGLELARITNPAIDQRVKQTLQEIPELRYSPHITKLYSLLK